MNVNKAYSSDGTYRISEEFAPSERIVVYPGDCLDLLRKIPNESLRLVVTSPPYNIGKEYEKRLNLDHYLEDQGEVIAECVRALSPRGSYADNRTAPSLDN